MKIFIKYDENVTLNCGWWPQTHWVTIVQKLDLKNGKLGKY